MPILVLDRQRPWRQRGPRTDQHVFLDVGGRAWSDSWAMADYAANERRTQHKQLIVLDLNGTLLHRTARNKGRRKGYARPYLDEFLQFALDHFAVMVWSSAQPQSIREMLAKLMSPYSSRFVRVWDRRFCELDRPYFEKAACVKDLRRISDGFTLDESPYRDIYGPPEGYTGTCADAKGRWALDNIIIVDDSATKIERNPANHILVSTFADPAARKSDGTPADDDLLRLKQYLEGYVERRDTLPSLLAYLEETPWLQFRGSQPSTGQEQDHQSAIRA
ncbi:hypothetical protein H4R18_000438 [Coemansia javaensis]|uniref:Mitochondrial import inner membrane translocase subunit TIM50 n=1 Tax=Coemansia javaensis TaxID=2761396 RepID=A0A9W8HJT5_9FUNG|nr:hypothetical protein H4R18_000438 [Coemansia javaensis]